MSAVEFSRPRRLDTLGTGATDVTIEADAGERAALAARFELLSLDWLTASFTLSRVGDIVRATGRVHATATQPCIATGDPVPAEIDEEVALAFVPETDAATGDEVELAEGDCDTVFYDGGSIDLGEAAAETLALTLDPFPRSARAEEVMREAGVLSEEEAKPAGALAGLKDLLAKKD